MEYIPVGIMFYEELCTKTHSEHAKHLISNSCSRLEFYWDVSGLIASMNS